MKTREELIQQQEKLLAVYEKVKDQLKDYPNVVNIGIGVKETGGDLTDEGCITIVVNEKKNESDLDPHQIIPKEIEGVRTDVIIQEDKLLQPVCTEDHSNHRPIKGGIAINNYRNGSGRGGSGTLGVMAQLNSDNSWVILSNHHVLYGDSGGDNDEIGQPWVGCCCCCKTNVIATNLNKNEGLDCAIAKVKGDIGISNVIEEIGNIGGAGAVAAVNGERVRKRGARTGFTSGTISFIDPTTKEITVTPKAAGGPANDPGGCTNYQSGVTVFSYYGDSGSVYLNDNNEVVGLHFAGNNDASRSFGKDILQVQTALGITIKTTSSASGRAPQTAQAEPNQVLIAQNDWVSDFEEKLKTTEVGLAIKAIFKKHEYELFNLINKNRPVTLTWQRKQGPAYIAAFGRSVKHADYTIPPLINSVSLQNLLMSMAAILEEHGTEALREDVQKYSLDIIQLSRDCHTANDFFEAIARIDGQTSFYTKLYTH